MGPEWTANTTEVIGKYLGSLMVKLGNPIDEDEGHKLAAADKSRMDCHGSLQNHTNSGSTNKNSKNYLDI